jgi:hypothetical protein
LLERFLCAALAVSESRSALAIWRDRFSWASLHFLIFGPLALLAASAEAQLGPAALVAFLAPSHLLAHSMHAALKRVHHQTRYANTAKSQARVRA